ncbi:MAG: hypothetical protein ACI93R_001400 [Flavobacteriales bacterium]|jgi:hypothetical protein
MDLTIVSVIFGGVLLSAVVFKYLQIPSNTFKKKVSKTLH